MHLRPIQKSDEELWELLRSGNRSAFSLLYKRHIKSLLHFGLKITPDQDLIKDTLQELFVEFWDKRHSLSVVKQVKAYLIKSFRYKLLRAVSQKNKTQVYALTDLMKDVTASELIENELSSERKRQLSRKLQRLPERQREVIHLRYFQNLSNGEIADIINVNKQSVSNLLQRALTNLRKDLVTKRSAAWRKQH